MMNSILERLLSLRVADVMTHQRVVEISPNQTLDEAAEMMAREHVSGAPVVDEQGHCVGILSAFDFVLKRHLEHVEAGDLLAGVEHCMTCESGESPFSIDTISGEKVRAHMSGAVQSIAPQATLINAARAMCGAHVHRLPVLDSEGRVLGIVSSLDIVAALVNAVEEGASLRA
jgi:CBS domain-containing protein